MSSNIIFFLSNLNGGGAQRIVISVANSIEKSKLVTIYDTPSAYECSVDRVSLASYSSKRLIRILKTPLILFNYILEIKRETPLVCISALPDDNLINIIASIITRIPAIISVHGMPSHKYSNIDKMVKSIVFFLAKINKIRVIAVSNGVRDELVQLYGMAESQISVIHNPIDILTIQKLSKDENIEPQINPNKLTLITVGRLNAVKGQWHLIRTFAELRKKYECMLIICGDGPEKEYLSRLVRDLSIEGDVVFLGWQENPYKYMKKATIFVQSSLSEALPNVLIEAMVCGCPVVATNCSPGIEEIMGSDNTCGIISKKMNGVRHTADEPLDDSEIDFLNSLKKILDDVELRKRMSCDARRRAKLFDVDVGIQKYVELIEESIAST